MQSADAEPARLQYSRLSSAAGICRRVVADVTGRPLKAAIREEVDFRLVHPD